MSEEEAIKKLKELQDDAGDWEAQHGEADEVLCEFLETLGFFKLVAEYSKVPKWYA